MYLEGLAPERRSERSADRAVRIWRQATVNWFTNRSTVVG